MDKLDLEKFNPTKAEIAILVEDSKKLVIEGLDDKEGYKRVHDARMVLKKTRVEIQKTGKLLRTDALAFQKAVITKEKELTDLIDPAEKSLESKQRVVDEQREQIKRLDVLPNRRIKLYRIDVVVSDDSLLQFDDAEFLDFYNVKHEKFLEKKELAIQEEKDKIEADKKKLEEAKRIAKAKEEAEAKAKENAEEFRKQVEADLEEARKKVAHDADEARKQTEFEAQEARKQAEADKKFAIEEEKRKAEVEKQEIIDMHKARDEAEAKLQADLKAKDKEKAEAREKDKKYQAFLKEHNYDRDNFYVLTEINKVTLYKKIAELNL